MKLSCMTFCRSLLLIGVITSFSMLQADLPKTFDYNKASTNYVDNTSSGTGFGNPYYIGGAIGQSEATSYCDGASGCEDNDSAWKVFGGYRVTEKLSVEGAYINLGDVHKDGENSDVSAIGVYGVGNLPVTEKFDAFAKIGATHWISENSDGKESGFGMAYGIGGKMNLNETTKIRAEWEKIMNVETSKSEESDVNMLSIGVEFSTF